MNFIVSININKLLTNYCLTAKLKEAVMAVLDFLFHKIGFNRITASYNEENIASGKVMKKVGMSYEGTCREAALRKNGTFGNLILYAILKSDYI